ncbi:binding-protein-dependent transport systems inner membrane component [Beutenbergia cavernae DSM 12333]|uniref:Binding-protein-dependent transport systems inner membrane component n=1 Tax=Beutenbergia cavernae (strain ATCC BAA-8 / DSM 12333 / CCUG 43141 / JCM 11478 / NBRC 16432 / NCIMB 13614 / HKI 0122) TaxID=471853 RepID=C5C3L0_BEUC1|nr:carbohydrate ABC transporter permease [Beutenbergia cavernae]ACQ81919.1 binding-protein-dependent transport systems inner membrane component [Beutenbergia cavernae DSM 12333]
MSTLSPQVRAGSGTPGAPSSAAGAPRRRAARRRWSLGRVGAELGMLVVAAVFFFPFYVFLAVALKTPADLAASPLAFPTDPALANFAEAWQRGDLGQAMGNSVVVTALSVALLVLAGSFAAYALARRASRLSYGLYLAFLLGLMIPLQLGMVPLYQLMRDANLLQTYTSLIIFEVGHQLPLVVFLYTGFLRALPREYEEAARVDGAGTITAFRKIVFPLLRPITGTVVILTSINIWNDFLTPLLYVGGSAQQTLPVAIFAFRGEFASQWQIIFAGMGIAILPILVVYFLLQKYIIKGFASGIKG